MPRERETGDGGLWYDEKKNLWFGSVEIPSYDGKRHQRRVSSRSKSKAADKLKELRAKVQQGKIPITNKTTVSAWLDVWLKNIKPHVAPKTYRFYADSANLHVKPHIGGVRLDQLTIHHVEFMIDEVETTRNKQCAHMALRMAIKMAVARGLLDHNVVEAVKRPEHRAKTRPALALPRAKGLMESALELDHSSDQRPLLAVRWFMGLSTATRKGEVIGLEIDRIDFDRAEADISWQLQQLPMKHGCDPDNPCGRQRPGFCPQMQYDVPDKLDYRVCYRSLCWTRPKSQTSKRILPLTWPLLPMLEAHVANDRNNPHGLVWHHRDGRPISPREDHTYWKELIKYAGLEDIPMHVLRHTAATIMDGKKIPQEVRMQIMGQNSVSAHHAYVHRDTTQAREALGQYGRLIAPKAVGPAPADAKAAEAAAESDLLRTMLEKMTQMQETIDRLSGGAAS